MKQTLPRLSQGKNPNEKNSLHCKTGGMMIGYLFTFRPTPKPTTVSHCGEKRLHAWLSLLKWPDAEQENDPGITWFEMLLNFRVVTQSTVPVNLGTAQRPIHALPEQSEVARLTPKSWKRELHSFEASLRTLRLILNGPIFPCEPMRLCRSLQWCGYCSGRLR